jgi:hypothetical protein
MAILLILAPQGLLLGAPAGGADASPLSFTIYVDVAHVKYLHHWTGYVGEVGDVCDWKLRVWAQGNLRWARFSTNYCDVANGPVVGIDVTTPNPTTPVLVYVSLFDSDDPNVGDAPSEWDDVADIDPTQGGGCTNCGDTYPPFDAELRFRYYAFRGGAASDHVYEDESNNLRQAGQTYTYRGDGFLRTEIGLALSDNAADNDPPTSSVLPLAADQEEESFEVAWQGSDTRSGVHTYSIFVSAGTSSSFIPWITGTNATTAVFTGSPGTRYCFYSRAIDNASINEAAKSVADTCTSVADRGPLTIQLSPASSTVGETLTRELTARVTGMAGSDVTSNTTIEWEVSAPPCGTVSPAAGPATTFTATAPTGANCTVSARATLSLANESWTVTGASPISITAGQIAVSVSPETANPHAGTDALFSAMVKTVPGGTDITGNATTVVSWSVVPPSCGGVMPAQGAATAFSANISAGGTECALLVSAVASGLSEVRIVPLTIREAGPLHVVLFPPSGDVEEGSAITIAASVTGAAGHNVSALVQYEWRVTPATCGAIDPPAGTGGTTFTAAQDAAGRECVIIATASLDAAWSATGSATVTVGHAAPIRVQISVPSTNTTGGQEVELTATVEDAHGHDLTTSAVLAWGLEAAECGELTAGSGGKATFTASAVAAGSSCRVRAAAVWGEEEAEATLTLDVHFADPLTVVVDWPLAPIAPGQVVPLHATVRDANGVALGDLAVLSWNVSPASCGAFDPPAGLSTVLTVSEGAAGEACAFSAAAEHLNLTAESSVELQVEAAGGPTEEAPFPWILVLVAAAVAGAGLVGFVFAARRARNASDEGAMAPGAAMATPVREPALADIPMAPAPLDAGASTGPRKDSTAERLGRLETLRREGVVTQQEYEAKRKEILDRL